MALTIKDPETEELARKLAERTGESITQAVKRALRERLARKQRSREASGLANRLLEIGRRCAGQMQEPPHSSDHGDLLYDESGLPR